MALVLCLRSLAMRYVLVIRVPQHASILLFDALTWRDDAGAVGLYVPGGTAVLPSSTLMMAVPAQIAGCKTIVMATPPRSDGQVCILSSRNNCFENSRTRMDTQCICMAGSYMTAWNLGKELAWQHAIPHLQKIDRQKTS